MKPILELYLWNMVEIKGIFEGRFKRRFWIFGFWEVLYCVGSTLYFFKRDSGTVKWYYS